MSTRSVIAEPQGDDWRGRYCHSDGYPSHQLVALHALVRRDGVDVVRKTLLHDHAGWSFIDPAAPDLDGAVPDRNAPYGSPAQQAYAFSPEGSHGDGRFANIPGYGIAYTTTKFTTPPLGSKDKPYQQVSEDEWYAPFGDAGWTEWCYVLHEDHIAVLAQDGPRWTLRGTVRYDQELTPTALENLGD